MEFLKSQIRFDFLYGGTPISALDCHVTQREEGNVLTTVYTLADGLQVTNVATKHGEAYEWVNWLENTADTPSQVISQLWDACVTLPMPHEEAPAWSAYRPAFEDVTTLCVPKGSVHAHDEFCAWADRKAEDHYEGHLGAGQTKTYTTLGGRSSDTHAPFFHLYKGGKGYVFAIGWSGQWLCSVTRNEDNAVVKSGLEQARFYLEPHETLRTSSFVLMPYEGDEQTAHNRWRRLIREHFSLIGREGRDSHGPLCAGIWGGMKTESALQRIEAIKEHGLPFEYVWMDAGWYGGDTAPTPDEFEGDWWAHTGDWRVSPRIHPGGLKDVAAAVHEAGMKFLLWFEPERVRKEVPIVAEHPEYFLFVKDPEDPHALLNLGDEAAWQYGFATVAGLIETIGIDGYRQDFNFHPIEFWRQNDPENRQGICEIKHINGLYRLWDALLERFPHLLIDNCASGGRRIDIETLRRSIPLWRTDYACSANFPVEGLQCHHLSFNRWMPYSGTGTGRDYDTYRVRSAYSPALTANYTFSERNAFGDDPEKMVWLRGMLEEYKTVRPFMAGDFYPLTEVSDRLDVWAAAQFHRPAAEDGILQVFRRERSPYETARFVLSGVAPEAEYVFTDTAGEERTVSGKELQESGFAVTLTETRSSEIYFYKRK